MKKLFLLSSLIFVWSLSALNLNLDSSFETTYSDNVLKLSNHDLNRFNTGNDQQKFKLKTTDDLIMSVFLKIGFKNKLLTGHTQKNEFYLKFNKHLQNSFLDDGYLGYKFNQYLNKRLNFELSYFYYPEIYVNRYTSELDKEDIYRDFTYAKNAFAAEINWKARKFCTFTYRIGFSQLFYNKYFTEYDAENIENKLTINLLPKAEIRTQVSYKYKISRADGKDAFVDPTVIEVIKDASYEANTYSLSFRIPKLFTLAERDYSLDTGIDYEQRYFTNDNAEDQYHYARNDYILTTDFSIKFDLNENISLNMNSKYQRRRVQSPFAAVERDKKYELFEVGLKIGLSY